ncbi:MAG TPA: FAD-binding and (Fe-S)-binding domain-containing protein [Thermomicrobiaceae bacterium]|nr:FAD-binding and (Fe-S)-binding domain-containing protein [Thermomicrobiaceae bacterium]
MAWQPILTGPPGARRGRPAGVDQIDVGALIDVLRSAVRGEVRFGDGDRALYATDSSNYRQVPLGVVIPRSVDDLVATVAACRRFGAPILARGCGTSLAGQSCNVAVIIDCSKYLNRVLAIDPERQQARVEPGTILDDLRREAERSHLTFGPDPATHDRCTLGGMIGNNSCGVHSVMAGKTDVNVDELEVLTYDGTRLRVGPTSEEELARIIAAGGRRGEIYAALKALRDRYAGEIRARFPDIPRRVSGYGLEQLLPENGFHVARALVGTEGTCVTVLEATVRLVHSPSQRVLLLLGYPDIYTATAQVPEIMRHGVIGLEGFDDGLVRDERQKGLNLDTLPLLPHGDAWLLAEFGADTSEQAVELAQGTMEALRGRAAMRLVRDPAEQARVWRVREAALGALAIVGNDEHTWPGWEDSAVAPERFSDYLRDLRALMDRFHYSGGFYGHFGQGCLHTRMNYDLVTEAGIETFHAFIEEAADLVVRYGGSLSGEHGDGQSRAALLPKMFGPELVRAFGEFKAIWDPDNRMNPGKVVDPYPLTSNLRLGTGYNPTRVRTHFAYPEDRGSFARAALRCVGVGACRRLGGGTMCPSFMVTREEEHSTRGRARLLWEMMQGETIDEGWRSEKVHQALDLCLACKGCKSDCPVHVDMATYKAEFLSHYYAGRLRPRTAYSLGLIYWVARLAAHAPGLANLFTQTPGLRVVAKTLAGATRRRPLPAFAARTFKQSWRPRATGQGERRVILWPDTFNNHFLPETLHAAVEVLETAGFQVSLPRRSLCCGRPLYDYGMLDLAKRLLAQILDELRTEIRAGVPLVGMEPSCVAVFRDELPGLFPDDEDALRLSRQSFLLGELLERYAPDFQWPRLERAAVLHLHCHHKSLMGTTAAQRLLGRLGLDATLLDDSCCGLAGAFGYEPGDHYDVSLKAGERVLLPAVRAAEPETLIVADGFSCREQIAQLTGRRALHPVQVLRMALREGPDGPAGPNPERSYRSEAAKLHAGPAVLGGALALGAAWALTRGRQ